MGFIRGGLVIILSSLLIITLLVGNTLWTVNMSLEYGNVKSEISEVIEKVMTKDSTLIEDIDSNIDVMQKYCQNNSDYVFKQEGMTFAISCESISQGSEAVINEGIEDLVRESYYKEYTCGFISCFREMTYPFFLISEQTKNKAGKYFYILVAISIALILLIILLSEKRSNAFIIAGAFMIIAALPFMKANWFFSNSENVVMQFLAVFLSESFKVFVVGITIGITLLIIGIIMKIFGVGFTINSIISKFKKTEKTSGKTKVITKTIIKPAATQKPLVEAKAEVVKKK